MKRSRFEIMAEIVQVCFVPQGKTRIVCKVKLNFMRVNAYLSELASLGLLSKVYGKYEATEKGRQFMSAYNDIGRVIGMHEQSLAGLRA
jgi:predicted transcriptional regulator